MPNIPIISFNTGETTPFTDARSDVAKYASSCRIMENMLPLVYGPATRRPGTKYIATAKNSPDAPRLIPFIYSSDIAYMCAFGNLYVRFFYNSAQLLVGGDPVETTTPFLLADMPQVQYAQLGDTQWLVHEDYPPQKMIRTTATSFIVSDIVFETGPFRIRNDIENDDGVTMKPSVSAEGASGTLTASAATFEDGHAGALWSVIQERATTEVTLHGSGDSAALDVKGNWSFVTTGAWDGTIVVQRTVDDEVTWEDFRTYTGLTKGARNIRLDKTETEDGIKYRIHSADASANFGATLQVFDHLRYGIVRIDAVASSTVASITVLRALEGTDATKRWAEGAWSAKRGFPAGIIFFEDRAVYAGPGQFVWFSATDDYENFDAGVNDNNSFGVQLTTTNNIEWISALDAVVVGTSGDEWQISPSKLYVPLTPANFRANQQTVKGCQNIQAIRVDRAILFIDKNARKIREFALPPGEDRHDAPDLTILAEHVTESGVTAMAYQKNPGAALWCRRSDGTLISMRYERNQDVVAWARHPMGITTETTSSTTTYSKGVINYEIAYVSENGAIWGIPFVANSEEVLRISGSARDAGGGTVGITCVGHPFSSGQTVRIEGTTNYAPLQTLTAATTEDELVITDTYIAEDFDGTESVVQYIATAAGWARATQALDGTMYVGYKGGVAKITDGTTVDLTWYTPAGYGARDVSGLELSADESFLIVYWRTGVFHLERVNVADATREWIVATGGTISEEIALDRNDNIYIPACDGTVTKSISIFNPSDGAKTNMIDCGTWATYYGYEIHVDDDIDYTAGHSGVVIAGGYSTNATETNVFNLFIRSLDNQVGAKIALGERTVGGSGFILPIIATGYITTLNGYIYVLCGSFIYKLNGSGEIQTTIAAPSWACGIEKDIWGRIIVVTQNYTTPQTTIFNFYDEDLVLQGAPTGQRNSICKTWTAAVGGSIAQGNIMWYPGIYPKVVTTETTQDATGTVESVAVIPGEDEDEVWLSVVRPVGATVGAFIEQMQPMDFGDQEDAFFVECGVKYDGEATNTITGLGHLEEQTVGIWADGAVFPPQEVSDGKVTLSETFTKAVSGLRFRYKLKPMRTDVTGPGGTSKGSKKTITKMVISFLESLNVKYGKDIDNLHDIDFRTTEPYGSPPDMYTGDKIAPTDGGWDPEDPILISGDDPAPCTVRALIPQTEITKI